MDICVIQMFFALISIVTTLVRIRNPILENPKKLDILTTLYEQFTKSHFSCKGIKPYVRD